MSDVASSHRLLYRSDCALPGTQDGVDRAVADLVNAAGAANEAADITGALIFSAGIFVQVLEGPLPALEATFERISRDLRHRRVRLLGLQPAAERLFREWGMVRVPATIGIAALCRTLWDASQHSRQESQAVDAAVHLMLTVLKTENGTSEPRRVCAPGK